MKNLLKKAGLAAGLFFPLSNASATTFGPITVANQAANTQYYVHGRVVGSPWVEMEPRLGRPYTYWKVQISEQLMGDDLGGDLIVREPGGEIGDMGYHLAGTAEFTAGEDTFIALHDTDQAPNIKEVMGLAAGKYRVESGKNGQQVVMSGLGLPVTGQSGQALTPREFSALLRRIANGEATEADKDIWVSRRSAHEQDEDPSHEELARKFLKVPERTQTDSVATTDSGVSALNHSVRNPPSSKENSVQESPPKADEASTGFSSWGFYTALAVLAGLTIGLYLALRR